MKTDILNTTQNPDELRRLAQDLLDKQTQRIHTLENDNAAIQAEKTALEQHIRGQEVMMLAATTAYEQRIRELEEALKLAQSGASAVKASACRPVRNRWLMRTRPAMKPTSPAS